MNDSNQGTNPAPIYQVVALPTPATKKKAKKQDLTLVYVLVILAILATVFLIGPAKVADTLVGIAQGAGLPVQEDCGVPNSTRLRFAEKTYKSGDSQVTFVGPNPIPSLTEQDSIVCFDTKEMQTFYGLQISWLDGKTRPGIEVLANIIVANTTKVAGKSGDGDVSWEKTLFEKLLPALSPDSFRTEGVPEGYAYLVLPGYIGPAATPTTISTVTPTEQPVIIIPTGTSTPIPTPTALPRPTQERIVTQAWQQLATLQIVYDVTPLPPMTPLPSVPATSLDFFLSELGGAAACSYLRLDNNYDIFWPPPDNIVTVYIGPDCTDGNGMLKKVQLPSDLVARHVGIYYKQIWFTAFPQSYRGPAFSLGNGIYIQPFNP